ncbi:alkaline phosphatase family protein [Candidatus Amarolinea aalborgensis]|uniref:alkaline phosphatase family protein n=1 Tax=Candidatus Amarolinea aalborgensis TaxID=2249329 RepID=UPI003BF9C116
MTYRCYVIGLDGATFDLILPWVAQGKLPAFADLLRRGAWGQLRSTVPPMTGPAWTTFATGANPARHSIYDWVYREPGTYNFVPATARNRRLPSLWSLLSAAGRRVCVVNVPMTFPPEPVNGLLISGLPTPSKQVTFTIADWRRSERLTATISILIGQAYFDVVDAFPSAQQHHGTAHQGGRKPCGWEARFLMVSSGTGHRLRHGSSRGGASARRPASRERCHSGSIIRSLAGDVNRPCRTVLMLMSDPQWPIHSLIHVNNVGASSFLRIVRLAPRPLPRVGSAPCPFMICPAPGVGHSQEVARGQGAAYALLLR